MRRGMDYIKASLDLLPAPAALYDLTDRSLVDGNAAALKFVANKLGDVTQEEARAAFGVTELLDDVVVNSAAAMMTGHGCILHGSVLPAGERARPDLALVTLHCDVTAEEAHSDHRRMCMTLLINETGQDAIQSMEAMLIQLRGTLRAQQAMLDALNAEVGDLLRRHYPKIGT